MQFFIRHKNLIDFPYDSDKPRYQDLFSFDDEKVNNLVSEILYASPTCYLVSGYRGAGKTSFIQRVKQQCIDQNIISKEFKAVLFVYSSFSRFESKTFFLRKIIRDLQDAIMQDESIRKSAAHKELKDLYNRTFNEVKREWSQSEEETRSTEISLDLKKFIGKFLIATFPFLLPFVVDLLLKPFFASITWTDFPVAKVLVYAVSMVLGLAGALEFSKKYTLKQQTNVKVSETSLSDDNITEYQLERILTKFINEKYKLVFVLDELDKIEQAELDLLLKEMKPWLVRGKVDFILVAGQKLTMQYYQLREGDDEILASLFSKVIHINQLSDQQLTKIFREYLIIGASGEKGDDIVPVDQLDSVQKEAAYDLCNSFIYRSKCIPRTFMNLLRQELQWQDGRASLQVHSQHFAMEKMKMAVLRKIFEGLALNADIPETVRGHLVMQLFRVAAWLTEANVNGITPQDLYTYILGPKPAPEAPVNYPYLAIVPLIKECLDLFFNEAKKAGLIPSAQNAGASTADAGDNDVLKEFTADFLSFMSIADGMAAMLYPNAFEDRAATPVSETLQLFVNKKAITFGELNSQILSLPLGFYNTRSGDKALFTQLKELLAEQNISFTFLYQQLFGYYIKNRLEDTFGKDPNWFFEAASLAEGQETDFSVRHMGTDMRVLLDYRFVNGLVSVGSAEVEKAIDTLDDYNLQTNRGSYYCSIVFYRSTASGDDEGANLAANFLVEKMRPDLKDRIRFCIISIYQFESLTRTIENIKKTATPYSLTPVLLKPMPKKDGRPKETRLQESSSLQDPDDPQKGRWGGEPEIRERRLSAIVSHDPENKGSYVVNLKVESTNPDNPLTGRVTFHLHPGFSPNKRTVLAKGGIAELNELRTNGSFTVGATCDNNTTMLELEIMLPQKRT